LSRFDAELAASLGFAPAIVHYALMSMIASDHGGAFSAVGAILAVVLIVVPSVTASLLTRRLPVLVLLAIGIGITTAVSGYGIVTWWNVSPSSMIATMLVLTLSLRILLYLWETFTVDRKLRSARWGFVAATSNICLSPLMMKYFDALQMG
jgi:manganese/zinc/iron transport system permease protein